MSIASAPPQETLAKAPFNDPRADVILQSIDGVRFRVFKIMLSFASTVFSDMFSIPPPSSKNVDLDDEIQTVLLSENSDALDLCLRHVYPLQTPDSAPLRDTSILAEFAHKYQVDVLDKTIRHYLTDNIKHDPVGVYAIAVTYGYRGVGKSAAESCLNLPFSRIQSPYARYATTENFAELLRYHVSCGEASSAVATDRTWFSSLGQITFVSIGNRNGCHTCAAQDFMDLNANAHGEHI
jgi:hypothetical protein